MPPAPRRLSDAQRERIDTFATEAGVTRSEAIRRLVNLGADSEPILGDFLEMLESLPSNKDLDRHIAEVRRLVETPPNAG